LLVILGLPATSLLMNRLPPPPLTEEPSLVMVAVAGFALGPKLVKPPLAPATVAALLVMLAVAAVEPTRAEVPKKWCCRRVPRWPCRDCW
jgi:uncharacterized membrane protein YccC